MKLLDEPLKALYEMRQDDSIGLNNLQLKQFKRKRKIYICS